MFSIVHRVLQGAVAGFTFGCTEASWMGTECMQDNGIAKIATQTLSTGIQYNENAMLSPSRPGYCDSATPIYIGLPLMLAAHGVICGLMIGIYEYTQQRRAATRTTEAFKALGLG
jgi:hypothetical protein